MKNKIILCGLLIMLGNIAYATSGAKMIGQTTRATGMGGASIAVTEDASSSDSNPAALAFIENSMLQLDVGLIAPRASFEIDGREVKGKSMVIPLPNFSYAHKFDSDFVLGVSLSGEGGLGTEYHIPTLGKVSSNIAYGTLNITGAYKITNNWSVGVTPYVSYSGLDLQVLEALKVKDMNAVGYGVRVGTIYSINEKWNVGAKYTTKDRLNYHGKYELAGGQLKGKTQTTMAWPEEVVVGTSYKFNEKILVALDVKFINWSNAMKNMDMKIGEGTLEVPLDWKDQMVYAIGIEYSPIDKLKLRLGDNYGASPIRSDTLTPLMPLITEHHITVGAGYEFFDSLTINGSVEYAFDNSQKNQALNTTSKAGGTIGSIGISYKFN